jgi:hypothetical protein
MIKKVIPVFPGKINRMLFTGVTDAPPSYVITKTFTPSPCPNPRDEFNYYFLRITRGYKREKSLISQLIYVFIHDSSSLLVDYMTIFILFG